jgi:hypothetical protein
MLPILSLALLAPAAEPDALPKLPLNTWVKRSPLADGPPSPGMGYEGSLAWDAKNLRVIRWAGHNQGGGGEQNAETWTFDPLTAKWELKEPNISPPGACCNAQNLFDPDQGRFLRFPAFSGSHGWQWYREIYLGNSTVWNYDLATNTWRDRRPVPAPRVAPLRCASWDSDHQVAVIFGGEGSREGTLVYDPYTNTWHRMKPKDEPDPRSGGNMAYDPVVRVHVMFGTQFDNDPATWTYDLRKNTWTAHKPNPSPPTDRNDPVLAFDHASKRVIAVVRAIDKGEKNEVLAGHTETWAFDAGRATWMKLDPKREPEGWGNRARVMVAMPELNALLLESVVHSKQMGQVSGREQQIWLYRSGEAKPREVGVPANVRVGGELFPVVEWDPVPGADRYRIYRAFGDTPWTADFVAITKLGVAETRFADGKLRSSKQPVYYRVTAVKGETEGDWSPVTRAQPRVADDLVASVVSAKEVRLAWKPVAGGVGYHVERAPVEVFTEDQIVRLKKDTDPLAEPSVGAIRAIGKFERITREPVKAAVFTDTGIDLAKLTKVEGEATFTHRFAKEQIDDKGKPYQFGVYAYRVLAVNGIGVEGGPSAWVPTIPSGVQHVSAKEDGTDCHLKWTANPEGGIKGYRMYRMDGPKINGPGQKVVRLNAEPINAMKWTDETKATETKRYWVVAVDAIGQEGIPSAPAWGWRQFRKVYENFTGEWHQ